MAILCLPTRASNRWRIIVSQTTLASMRRGTTNYLGFALFALFTLGGGLASPAMALAHGVAHHRLSGHGPADLTSQESGVAFQLISAEQAADHPALHNRQCAARSPSPVLPAPIVSGTMVTTPKGCAAPVAAKAADLPPTRFAPPEQPRAPPRR